MRNLLISAVLLLPVQPLVAEPQVVGEAYRLGGDELLYREFHTYSVDGSRHQVEYLDTDGNQLADKVLDYSAGSTTPQFIQLDYRTGQTLSVLRKGERLVVSRGPAKALESREIKLSEPLVIDAGFDAFVRHNWDRLMAGEIMRFHFPLANRARLIELQIKQASCSYMSVGDQCFSMQLSGWLLRMLAQPVELGYDTETRRLSRYRGLANIGDGNGKGLMVDIRYSYAKPASQLSMRF